MKLKGKCIGFDIGSRAIHVAVREDDRVTCAFSESLPDGIVRQGQILSYESMSGILKELRKNGKLGGVRDAAVVLPSGACYCRRLSTSYMTHEQLEFNLRYEFRDYIAGDKEDHFFDYALVETLKNEDGEPNKLDIMAAAVSKRLIADYTAMFRRAGLRLITAIPEELAYINIIRGARDQGHSHCILDLGYNAVRLFMFEGDRFENTRALDFGCGAIDKAIAGHFDVDIHTARSYRETDHEGAASLGVCQDIYNTIAVEVLKAVNFYRFNNRGDELSHVHCCGGGAKNEALLETLRSDLSLEVTDMSEFWPDMSSGLMSEVQLCAAAAGAAMQ